MTIISKFEGNESVLDVFFRGGLLWKRAGEVKVSHKTKAHQSSLFEDQCAFIIH